MADLDKARKELEALAAIADSGGRAKAINDRANVISELTGTPVTEVTNGLLNKVDEIIASQSNTASAHVGNYMPINGQAILEIAFDHKGISSYRGTLQTPSLETKVGNFAGLVSGGVNSVGDLTAATVGAKYVTPAFKSGDFTGVGIAAFSTSIPLNDAEMDASNVSATVGTVIWHKSGVSSISTLSTDGKHGNLIIGQDFSKNLAQFDNGTTLAAHLGGSLNVGGDTTTNILAGFMVQTRLTKDLTGWVAANAELQDVGRKNDVAGMLNVGVNGTPAESRESEEVHLDARSSTPNQYARSEMLNNTPTTYGSTTNYQAVAPVQKNEPKNTENEDGTIAVMSREYYALEGHKKQQQAYLNNAAKTFSENSGMDIGVSRQFVLNLFENEHQHQTNHELEFS